MKVLVRQGMKEQSEYSSLSTTERLLDKKASMLGSEPALIAE